MVIMRPSKNNYKKNNICFKIDVLIIKNVGGKGSFAKVEAARAMNILVLMIDRPQRSNALVISSVFEILKWVDTNL